VAVRRAATPTHARRAAPSERWGRDLGLTGSIPGWSRHVGLIRLLAGRSSASRTTWSLKAALYAWRRAAGPSRLGSLGMRIRAGEKRCLRQPAPLACHS
jgi:hypothetical protein